MPHNISGDSHAAFGAPGRRATADTQSADAFCTTSWTVVVAAGQGDSPEAKAALEHLCRLYWPPLYSYLRRSGHDAEPARDLTQQFFLKLLPAGVDQTRGPVAGPVPDLFADGVAKFSRG